MKKWLILWVALFFLAGTSLIKAEEVANEISLPVVKEYQVRKGKVTFPHARHVLDYQISCGTCHHEKKIKKADKLVAVPLTLEKAEELKAKGKDPFQCKTCHGDLSRKKFRKLFHSNCLSCHKELKAQGKKAPTKCRDCHVKPKRKAVEGC